MTLPLYGIILKWDASVAFIANALCYTPCVRIIPQAYNTSDNSKQVTRVSQFTTVEQEREREIFLEGLESGKRCTCVCTSHVTAGVENGQVALPFAECGILSYFRRCASSSLHVGLFTGICGVVAYRFPTFQCHVLFFLLHCCELRNKCNSFTIVASAAPYVHVIMRTRQAQRRALAMKTTLTPHLRISPYKGSVAIVQIQMSFHAVGRSFRPSGGS